MEEKNEKGFIENLKPRTAFKTGLVTGLGVMFAVGFFVLLGFMINGDNKTTYKSNSADNKVVANNNNPSQPTPQPTPQPTTSGEINIKPVSENDWIKGDENAKVTVIEFSDTECPFCKRFHATMNQVVEDYDGQVSWVYRHWPIPQLHSKAQKEAEATECAGEQKGNDGFWAYVDRIMEITPSNDGLREEQLPEIAEYIGLNVEEFNSCLSSGKYANKVKEQAAEAQAAGGRGTPYSVIISGDQKVPINGAQPIESVKAAIDSLL